MSCLSMLELQESAPLTCDQPSGQLNAGRLELVFKRAGSGKTFIDGQYSSYPFHVCRALYLDDAVPGMATVYTQSSSGGLYTQDCLRATMHVGTQAQAHLTTQASTIVHRATRGVAEQEVFIEVEEGALAEYLPDPVILLPDADLVSRLRVRAEHSATVILFDAFLGHDPDGKGRPFGGMHSEVVIENKAGRSLVIDRFQATGRDLANPAPGITGGYGCQGTVMAFCPSHDMVRLLEASRTVAAACKDVAIGTSFLPGACGVWARIMAQDGADLKEAMIRVWTCLRTELTGSPPEIRRK